MAEGFQRRRLKCEKLTDDRRWMPSHGKSSPCQRQGEPKKSGKVENRNWPSLMVTDLVYEFQMIWLRGTQITEWKRTDRRTRVKDNALVHSGQGIKNLNSSTCICTKVHLLFESMSIQ